MKIVVRRLAQVSRRPEFGIGINQGSTIFGDQTWSR
jgi:hypothetical protein